MGVDRQIFLNFDDIELLTQKVLSILIAINAYENVLFPAFS